MIRGIGIDLVEIERFSRAMERPEFCQRVFTENELECWKQFGGRAESAAGKFAAKEAVLKALGTGIGPVELREVEILKLETGAPVARLSGAARERLKTLGADSVFLSITHEKQCAAAVAVLEG
jgi:holo-[acyl-carrier protein] synthase